MCAYKVLLQKRKGKRSLGRHKIEEREMNFKEIE
jgi:hypothetical protein